MWYVLIWYQKYNCLFFQSFCCLLRVCDEKNQNTRRSFMGVDIVLIAIYPLGGELFFSFFFCIFTLQNSYRLHVLSRFLLCLYVCVYVLIGLYYVFWCLSVCLYVLIVCLLLVLFLHVCAFWFVMCVVPALFFGLLWLSRRHAVRNQLLWDRENEYSSLGFLHEVFFIFRFWISICLLYLHFASVYVCLLCSFLDSPFSFVPLFLFFSVSFISISQSDRVHAMLFFALKLVFFISFCFVFSSFLSL